MGIGEIIREMIQRSICLAGYRSGDSVAQTVTDETL